MQPQDTKKDAFLGVAFMLFVGLGLICLYYYLVGVMPF